MGGGGGGMAEWSAIRTCRFTSKEIPLYPMYRRLDGPQSWSRHFGKKNTKIAPAGIGTPTVQPVSYPNTY
jgi:hypothetical protein